MGRIRLALIAICLSLGLSLTGIFIVKKLSQFKQPLNAPRVVTIKIVYPPEIGSILTKLIEDYHTSKPAVQDLPIRVEMVQAKPLQAAEEIASGTIKTTAWITQTALASYVNSRLENLGAEQTQCRELFSTPIVFSARPGSGADLQMPTELSFEELAGLISPTPNIAVADLEHTHTGLSANLQLAYGVSQSSELLTSETLSQHKIESGLKLLQDSVVSYSAEPNKVLRQLGQTNRAKIDIAILSEQQLIAYNKSSGMKPLVAVYPKNGSYFHDYTICLSKSDWVSAAHKMAYIDILNHFKSADADSFIASHGYRLNGTLQNVNDRAVDGNLAKRRLPIVGGDVVKTIRLHWPKIRRASAILLVLDSSASMEGAKLLNAKNILRTIIAKTSQRDLANQTDQIGLLTFASAPVLVTPFSTMHEQTIAALDTVTAIGGSRVYDGLKQAFSLITSPELRNYRRSIIVVTDGGDNGSSLSLKQLISTADALTNNQTVELDIITIEEPDNKHSMLQEQHADLQELAVALSGNYHTESAIAK